MLFRQLILPIAAATALVTWALTVDLPPSAALPPGTLIDWEVSEVSDAIGLTPGTLPSMMGRRGSAFIGKGNECSAEATVHLPRKTAENEIVLAVTGQILISNAGIHDGKVSHLIATAERQALAL